MVHYRSFLSEPAEEAGQIWCLYQHHQGSAVGAPDFAAETDGPAQGFGGVLLLAEAAGRYHWGAC